MSNAFRTLMVPASMAATALAITNALGNGHPGMFTTKVAEGLEPVDGQPDTREVVGYISTGILDSDSPLLADAATLHAACEADPTVTLADCESLVRALDLTPDEPFGRMAEIKAEVAESVNAAAWVQPTGAQDAYPKGAVVSHGGRAWVNLTPANVWEPGVSGWRESWGQTQAGYPAWVQPTGAHDAYNIGDRVSFEGKNYESVIAANVWSPSVYPAGWKAI